MILHDRNFHPLAAVETGGESSNSLFRSINIWTPGVFGKEFPWC